MSRRRLADLADLRRHLGWLRFALRDRKVDVRLILEGLLDAIEALADLVPGPPPRPPAEPPPEVEEVGPG